MDETWVLHFTPESKEQSKQWKHISSPRQRRQRLFRQVGRVLADQVSQ